MYCVVSSVIIINHPTVSCNFTLCLYTCGIQTFQNGRFISFEQASRERDLKDTYFSVPLHKDSKICKVSMEIKEIGQFLHLASAPRVLTKFMKVSIAILRSED